MALTIGPNAQRILQDLIYYNKGKEMTEYTEETKLLKDSEDWKPTNGAEKAADEICVVQATPVADPTLKRTSEAPSASEGHPTVDVGKYISDEGDALNKYED